MRRSVRSCSRTRDRLLWPIAAVLVGTLACEERSSRAEVALGDVALVDSVSAAPSVPVARPTGVTLRVDTVATGLEVPWGVAILPDGRILVTERPGRIRVVLDGVLEPEPWATLDVYANEPGIGPESGLMGIALAPDFTTSGHVYVVATTWRTPGDRTGALSTRFSRRVRAAFDETAALKYRNQVLRFRDVNGRAEGPDVIVDELPAAFYHAGGGIGFGPDGMLYVSMGDALLPREARDPQSWLGRVHRYTPDGEVPADNPVPGSSTWAYGLRNTQAFTWLDDGTMLGVEHGPTGMAQEGGRAGHDELNVLVAGGDYGWPDVLGGTSSRGSRPALLTWGEPIAPGGVAVYRGPVAAWRGSLLVPGLRGRLERVVLVRVNDRWRAAGVETLLDASHGRLRAVISDASGALYLTTSNRDARGAPRTGDDLLLRLTPVASTDDAP